MSVLIPEAAAQCGSVIDRVGTRNSRPIMLERLWLLLVSCPPVTGVAGYRSVILRECILLSQAQSKRQESLRHPRELNRFDPATPIFRALCVLWSQTDQPQPLVALSCAPGRDSGQRATAASVVRALPGTLVTPQALA